MDALSKIRFFDEGIYQGTSPDGPASKNARTAPSPLPPATLWAQTGQPETGITAQRADTDHSHQTQPGPDGPAHGMPRRTRTPTENNRKQPKGPTNRMQRLVAPAGTKRTLEHRQNGAKAFR